MRRSDVGRAGKRSARETGQCRGFGRRTPLPVRDADDCNRLQPGIVFLAPPDRDLLVGPGNSLELSQAVPVHSVLPAADVLYRSLATTCGPGVVAVVLTGANVDGAYGVEQIYRAGTRPVHVGG